MSYPSDRLLCELPFPHSKTLSLPTRLEIMEQTGQEVGWFQAEKKGPRSSLFKLSCALSMLSGKPFGTRLLVEVQCVRIATVSHYKSRTSISRKADWFLAGSFRIH